MVEGSIQRSKAQIDSGVNQITPRRLEYSDQVTPIVELPDDDTDGRKRPQIETQVIPRPHRFGRITDERRRADNLLTDERKKPNEPHRPENHPSEGRRDFIVLKERL